MNLSRSDYKLKTPLPPGNCWRTTEKAPLKHTCEIWMESLAGYLSCVQLVVDYRHNIRAAKISRNESVFAPRKPGHRRYMQHSVNLNVQARSKSLPGDESTGDARKQQSHPLLKVARFPTRHPRGADHLLILGNTLQKLKRLLAPTQLVKPAATVLKTHLPKTDRRNRSAKRCLTVDSAEKLDPVR